MVGRSRATKEKKKISQELAEKLATLGNSPAANDYCCWIRKLRRVVIRGQVSWSSWGILRFFDIQAISHRPWKFFPFGRPLVFSLVDLVVLFSCSLTSSSLRSSSSYILLLLLLFVHMYTKTHL